MEWLIKAMSILTHTYAIESRAEGAVPFWDRGHVIKRPLLSLCTSVTYYSRAKLIKYNKNAFRIDFIIKFIFIFQSGSRCL